MDIEYLNECFIIDAGRGLLIARERPVRHFISEVAAKSWNSRFAGKVMGYSRGDGRLKVMIAHRRVYVHSVIYAIAHGVGIDDFGIIDHANGDSTDNRVANLREATPSQNCMNTIPARTISTGAKKGVRHVNGKWRARIQAGRKRYDLGRFETEAEASAAYVAAAKELHREFMRV